MKVIPYVVVSIVVTCLSPIVWADGVPPTDEVSTTAEDVPSTTIEPVPPTSISVTTLAPTDKQPDPTESLPPLSTVDTVMQRLGITSLDLDEVNHLAAPYRYPRPDQPFAGDHGNDLPEDSAPEVIYKPRPTLNLDNGYTYDVPSNPMLLPGNV